MLRLIRNATSVALLCCLFALLACGDDPVSPPEDTTPPAVSSVIPADGSSFVSVAANIQVTFSEAMDVSTMVASTITLQPAAAGTASYSDKVLTFDPDSFLLGDTTYTVTVSTGAKDEAGNSMASAYTWQFSTDLDKTPPTAVSTSPPGSAVDVPVNSAISVRFDEDMDPSTFNAASFQITPSVTGSITYADSTATFTPTSFLDGGQTYEVTLTTAVTDTAGNALPSDYVWQFTTLNDTSPPSGAIVTPEDSAVVGNTVEIEVAASDQTGVSRVVFYVDGAEMVGSDDFTEPYEYIWNASGLDTGSVHTLTAEVFDVLGNSAFVDTLTVHYLWRLLIADDDEDLIHRDINTVHVRSTGSLLEFRAETFGGWAYYTSGDTLGIDVALYLDTDQNRATGDTIASDANPAVEPSYDIGTNDIGADYRIVVGYHGDSLFAWNGSGWAPGTRVDILNVRENSNYFEVGVRLDKVGLPQAVDVVAFSYTLFKNPLEPGDPGIFKWDWAPNEGTGHGTYEIDGSFAGKRLPSSAGSTASGDSNSPLAPGPFN